MPASNLRTLDRAARIVLTGSVLLATALSWLALIAIGDHQGAMAPESPPSGAGGLAIAALMWAVMTIAMMLPPSLPWLALFGSTAGSSGLGVRLPLFAGGYFGVWLAISVAAAALQVGLARLGAIGADLRLGAVAGGLALIGAGLFQATPLKQACLAHCRNPLGFFLTRWQDGPAGALRMGLEHGLFCAGCCWALMALAFVLGAMNLVWMAAITVMIGLEQLAPRGVRLSLAFGLAFVVWGAGVIARS
jgi:predicted metal-binding membrane protein